MNPTLKKTELFIKNVLKASSDPQNVFTPFELCDEVLDKVPSLDGHILVVSNLEFVYSLKQRGVDMSNVSYLTPCPIKRNIAKKMGVAKCYMYDRFPTEELFDAMKFDVVVGNPPYQSPGKVNKGKLWPKFIELSFTSLVNINGYVSLVTPKLWLTNGQWETFFIKNNIIYLNIDECKKHFKDVHSSFSYFVVQHNSKTDEIQFKVMDGQSNELTYDNIPPAMDLMFTGINKKLIQTHDYFPMITSSGYNTSGFSSNKPSLSKVKTDTHNHFVVHKISHKKNETIGFWSSELDTTTYGVPRVVVGLWLSDWKRERMLAVTELLTCEQFRHFPVDSIEQAEILKTVLSSKLYTYYLYNMVDGNSTKSKASGSITNRAVSYFPKVDLTRSWTDKELYKHFNLTQEEIDLIESTITQ